MGGGLTAGNSTIIDIQRSAGSNRDIAAIAPCDTSGDRAAAHIKRTAGNGNITAHCSILTIGDRSAIHIEYTIGANRNGGSFSSSTICTADVAAHRVNRGIRNYRNRCAFCRGNNTGLAR